MKLKKPKKPITPAKKPEKTTKPNEEKQDGKISSNIENNVKRLEDIFSDNLDFILREMVIGTKGELNLAVAFMETLVDKVMISEFFLEKLSTYNYETSELPDEKFKSIEKMLKSIPAALDIEETDTWEDVLTAIVVGKAVFFLEEYGKAWIVEARAWKERGIAEPQNETVVQGPREGFVEGLQTNIGLLRRRLKTENFIAKTITIGTTTNNDIVVCYLKGVADDAMVKEVEQKINGINIEGLVTGNVINEFIEETPFTPFKLISTTERPDKIAASLLEGRVAILTENTPSAMIIPTVFWQFFQSSEDYYERFPIATFNRLVRMAAFVLVLTLTAFYVAIATYHQEMIPTQLALAMSAIRGPVPFPTVVEALFLEVVLEGLREAGLRLPKAAGQAVSIVGALVMGQAAVEAGLVSPQLVIIVAGSGVASFLIPDYSFVIALRLLKFTLIILASILGIYGLIMGLIGIMLHLNALEGFGVPYMSPVTPFKKRDMKDIFVRAPWPQMGKSGPKNEEQGGQGQDEQE
ncbi:spore germination protein [Alkalicella caledoniensis]|uniref:Spore germination protein n=1 Tax=Alkalicella caledoniensis TaxID=2731377 RepID=A0A7G9W511_ALKCA|nr:spore germination protein [Alkalicella caledoniensis]QNO13773.1 spore germination protein [Alkalicella caledoniensis]